MLMIPLFKKELEQEAITTKKMLSRIPDDRYDWKPHEKSMTIRQLSTHIAELPTWITIAFNTTELDFQKNHYEPTPVNNTKELLACLEDSLKQGMTSLDQAKEEQLNEHWVLRNGEQIISDTPKHEVIRMALCQIVHHRAQLGVYLRLLNIPIPGSYGPSADEMEH